MKNHYLISKKLTTFTLMAIWAWVFAVAAINPISVSAQGTTEYSPRPHLPSPSSPNSAKILITRKNSSKKNLKLASPGSSPILSPRSPLRISRLNLSGIEKGFDETSCQSPTSVDHLILSLQKVSESLLKPWQQAGDSGLLMTLHGARVDDEAYGIKQLIKYSLGNKKPELDLSLKELLLNDEGQPVDSSGEILKEKVNYLYVMHDNGKIYVVEENSVKDGRLYHSSLADDEAPIAAGMMRISGGRIALLNEDSGHYAPKNRVQYVVGELEQRGVIWSENFAAEVSSKPEVLADQRVRPKIYQGENGLESPKDHLERHNKTWIARRKGEGLKEK